MQHAEKAAIAAELLFRTHLLIKLHLPSGAKTKKQNRGMTIQLGPNHE